MSPKGLCVKAMLRDPAALHLWYAMNVQLDPEAIRFIEGLVAAGQFKSGEDAVAEGVRLLMSQQQLRAEIQKGIDEADAGLTVDSEEVFAELRERAKRLMESAE